MTHPIPSETIEYERYVDGLRNLNAEMLLALKDVTRICEAMRFTVGLGKHQLDRIINARAVITKASGGAS